MRKGRRRGKPRWRAPRDARVLMGILLKKRDDYLGDDYRQKHALLRDERVQRLRRMGFSDAAIIRVKLEDEADEGEDITAPLPHGVAEAFLEQSSRHFHGVPEDATDKRQSKKRKGGAAPDPARYIPPPDDET